MENICIFPSFVSSLAKYLNIPNLEQAKKKKNIKVIQQLFQHSGKHKGKKTPLSVKLPSCSCLGLGFCLRQSGFQTRKIFKEKVEKQEKDALVNRSDTDTACRRTEESKKGTAREYFFLVTRPILSCPTYRPQNGGKLKHPLHVTNSILWKRKAASFCGSQNAVEQEEAC